MKNQVKLKRAEFIKLSLMSGAALYLGCNSGTGTIYTDKQTIKDSTVKDSVVPNVPAQTKIQSFRLYMKEDKEYEILRHGFNKRIDKKPFAIAVCTTTEEVAQAVNYGRENKLPIAIKSGGHSFEGFSSNNDGLVIDLSEMNSVTWEDENTISVQPGCKLSQLYDAIFPKQKILPAGSCGGVGIGGLTLGGGYGLFGRKYGLTCDSLLELTMVDGKGNIVVTKNNDELLWACKGGGNGNFGVITSLKFSLHDADYRIQSFRFKIKRIENERVTDILAQWFSITENLPLDCFSAFVLNGKSLYILLTRTDLVNAETQKAINALSAITDTTSHGTPTPLPKALKGFYGRSKPLFFKNASAGFYKNYDEIKGFIPEVLQKVMDTRGMIYQVNTLGGKINDPDFSKNSAYSHRDKNYLSELQTYWDSNSETEKMIQAFEEVQQIFYKNGVQNQYRNYPDVNFKNWEKAYFGENYARLQKVKDTYDPDNLFTHEQSIKNTGS